MFHHPFCIYLLFVVCMKVCKLLIDRFLFVSGENGELRYY